MTADIDCTKREGGGGRVGGAAGECEVSKRGCSGRPRLKGSFFQKLAPQESHHRIEAEYPAGMPKIKSPRYNHR